ncbi:MAG: hypothetical protein QXD59_02740 [Candidatus Caldarchaeum sp.]
MTLVHEAGQWDWGVQQIPPGETVTLDIRALRDRQMASDQDQVIPRWIERGQARWTDVGPQRGLIGRVIIYDPRLKLNTSTNESSPPPLDTDTTGCISFDSGPCVGNSPDTHWLVQTAAQRTLTVGIPRTEYVLNKVYNCETGQYLRGDNISALSALRLSSDNNLIAEAEVNTRPPQIIIRPYRAGSCTITATWTVSTYYPNCDPAPTPRTFTAVLPVTVTTPSSITVQSPNGGQDWAIGSTQTIQWTSSNVSGNVKIELSRNGGGSYETLFASIANTGSVSWTVTGPATGQALIKVSSVETPSVSDTSDAPFILRQPPTGAPAIANVMPGFTTYRIANLPLIIMGIVTEGANSVLTLRGSNLNGAAVAIRAGVSLSSPPSLNILSIDPNGQSMQVNVFVPVDYCSDRLNAQCRFLGLLVHNQFGVAAVTLQVLPARLLLTSSTPSKVEPGKLYVLAITGYHCDNVTVSAADRTRLELSPVSIDTLRPVNQGDPQLPQQVITTLMRVPVGAAVGTTSILVAGPGGSQTVPVTIVPAGSPETTGPTMTIPIVEDVTMPVIFETPTLLLRGDDEPPDIPAQSSGGSIDLYKFVKYYSLVDCNEPVCPNFNNLPISLPVDIFGVLFGVGVNLKVEFYTIIQWSARLEEVVFAYAICLKMDGFAAIVGGPGVYFYTSFCAGGGTISTPEPQFGTVSNLRIAPEGCLEVTNPFQEFGVLYGTMRATGCCPGKLRVLFNSASTPWGAVITLTHPDLREVPLEVQLESVAPQITRVEFSPGEVQAEPGGAAVTVLLRAYVKIPGTGTGGQNVTVRVNRDPGRSLACISSSATPASLTQFVPANGVEVPFVFAVQLSVPSSCPLPGVLTYKAELSLNAGVNYFTCTAAGVEPSATLWVQSRAAPQVSVSIQPFTAVCTNGLSSVQVTVANLPQGDAVVMRFGRMSGTGEAKFYDANGQLLTEVRITSSSMLTIKGITPSSTIDNMNLNAFLASTINDPFPRILDAEAFTVLDFTFVQEGSTVIEPANNYSENTTLKITVTPTSLVQGWKVRFMENGTGIYDGQNGATDLTAKPVVSLSNGIARLTVKSVSNSTNLTDPIGPPNAKVFVHLLDANNQFVCTSGDLNIDQWVDANRDTQVDWLIVQSEDLLGCFKSKSGIVGEVASSVRGIRQVNSTSPGLCGATDIADTDILISPVCGTSFNNHRLNTNRELSKTVIHEARHVWQNTLPPRRDLGAIDDDRNPATPPNDDDLDHIPERVPLGSEGDGLTDSPANGARGDRIADPGSVVYQTRENDARAFEGRHGNKCPNP